MIHNTVFVLFVFILCLLPSCYVAVVPIPNCIGNCLGRRAEPSFSDFGYDAETGERFLKNLIHWMRKNGGSDTFEIFKEHGMQCCQDSTWESVGQAVGYAYYEQEKRILLPENLFPGSAHTPKDFACYIKLYMKSIKGAAIPIPLKNIKNYIEKKTKLYQINAIVGEIPPDNRLVLSPLLSYLNELLDSQAITGMTAADYAAELAPVLFPNPKVKRPGATSEDIYADAKNVLSILIEHPEWLETQKANAILRTTSRTSSNSYASMDSRRSQWEALRGFCPGAPRRVPSENRWKPLTDRQSQPSHYDTLPELPGFMLEPIYQNILQQRYRPGKPMDTFGLSNSDESKANGRSQSLSNHYDVLPSRRSHIPKSTDDISPKAGPSSADATGGSSPGHSNSDESKANGRSQSLSNHYDVLPSRRSHIPKSTDDISPKAGPSSADATGGSSLGHSNSAESKANGRSQSLSNHYDVLPSRRSHIPNPNDDISSRAGPSSADAIGGGSDIPKPNDDISPKAGTSSADATDGSSIGGSSSERNHQGIVRSHSPGWHSIPTGNTKKVKAKFL